MDLQYISNEHGETTAVIIPIQEWNNLTARHEDLKELSKETKPDRENPPKKKPSDFAGIITKEQAQEMHNYLKKTRGEWDRDI